MKVHNLAEFQKAAAEFALGLKPLSDRATVVGFYGDLGTGKTTFVQAVAKTLGVTETVNSPTFLIFKKYELPGADLSPFSKGETERGWNTLIHIDSYRLKSSDELRKLGFTDLLTDPQNLIFVEWADRVTDILPPDHIKLFFEFVGEDTRSVTVR